MADPEAIRIPGAPDAGAGGVGGGTGGAGGMGGVSGMSGGTGGAAGMPMFDGDACAQGETQACPCEGSAEMGERMCIANPLSPTGGELSECRNCPAAPDGGMMMGGAGGASGMSGGAGGMGGAGAGGMSGGAGGMSGGAGGMSGGAGGMSGCMCTGALECCRTDGTCGIGAPGLCF
jgi:hypothetical protein